MRGLDEDTSRLSDAVLVSEAQDGSSESFGLLVERHRPRLLGLLSRRAVPGVEPEDLVQETLTRAFLAIGSCDPARGFAGWLHGIALNVAASQARRRRHGNAAEPVDPADDEPGPAQQAERASERQSIWALAEQLLKPRQFEALQLRYARQLDIRELAQAMGITRVHAKVLLFRARQALLSSPRFVDAHGLDHDGEDRGLVS